MVPQGSILVSTYCGVLLGNRRPGECQDMESQWGMGGADVRRPRPPRGVVVEGCYLPLALLQQPELATGVLISLNGGARQKRTSSSSLPH